MTAAQRWSDLVKHNEQRTQLIPRSGRRETKCRSAALWVRANYLFRITAFILLAVSASRLQAQQGSYTYDASGNLVSVSASGALGPSIRAQPQNQLVESNTPVTVSVVASGLGDSYQWLSNGMAIAGATRDSLVLSNLPGTTFASYSVVIMNVSGVITSTPAALWLDSKGTGMPDWWQLEYFGNLNQQPYADYDGDGVDNLDEYLEGTNPANPNSYDPRLYIQTVRGSVTASPAQPYYTMGQAVTLTAIPDPGEMFLGWSGSASGTKSSISLIMNSMGTVTAGFGMPLGIALSNTNLIWTTGGSAPWFGQAEVSEDGMGAAQSGLIMDGGYQSTLQTVTNLSQTMYLSFWWSISAQPVNSLTFKVDGRTYASLTGGATDWQYVETNLLSGSHTLLWTYTTGSSLPTGIQTADSAWVGDVTLTPTNITPVAPVLNIERTGPNSVVLFWVAPDDWHLQQNFNLATTNWVGVTNPVNVIDGSNEVTITPLTSNQFFRLKFP